MIPGGGFFVGSLLELKEAVFMFLYVSILQKVIEGNLRLWYNKIRQNYNSI